MAVPLYRTAPYVIPHSTRRRGDLPAPLAPLAAAALATRPTALSTPPYLSRPRARVKRALAPGVPLTHDRPVCHSRRMPTIHPIAAYLRRHKLLVSDLARSAGVQRSTLSHIMGGRRAVSTKVALALSAATKGELSLFVLLSAQPKRKRVGARP